MKKILIILTILFALLYSVRYYCYNYFQFWTHLKTEKFETLREYNGENIKALMGRQILVHKDFIPLLIAIVMVQTICHLNLTVNQVNSMN